MAPRFPWTFLLMVFLIRGSETTEKVKHLVHLNQKLLLLKGVGEYGDEPRSQMTNGLFWYQDNKVIVADERSFGAKSAKRVPRMTSVLARKKSTSWTTDVFANDSDAKNKDKLCHECWTLWRENSKTLPVGDRRFGAKYSH